MSLRVKRSRALPCVVVSRAIEIRAFKHTNVVDLFHFIQIADGFSCGVVGDGDNGAYEWFVWGLMYLTPVEDRLEDLRCK